MPDESPSTPQPGEKALAVMKLVKDIDIFKTPTQPKVKKKRKKVLDEDSYVEEMGKIIQRDFFPDLEKLKAQNEYLDAVEKNDLQKLRELYTKYSSGKRPPTERYASPATFETPLDVRREDDLLGSNGATTPKQMDSARSGREDSTKASEGGCIDGSEAKKPSEDGSSKLSLDQYLNLHTSEDNQSFQEIMEEADVKHRQKYAWLYSKEENSEQTKNANLAVPSIEEQAAGKERPLMIDTWGYTNKNYIMYVPDGVALTPEEQVEQAKRKQEVVHQNTRLEKNPFDERQSKEVIQQLAQSQAHALEGKIGVDGKELTQANATPTVAGFSFVKTPSPAPGVNESPLMTWGEIEGTPFRLDGGDTPVRPNTGPSFRMPEPPKREKLALALAERAGERHRDRKTKAIAAAYQQLATPSPRPGSGTLERLNSMSPAARRLATAQLRTGDRALQASYSPSPRHRTMTTPVTRTPGRATPGPAGSASARAAVLASIRRQQSTPNNNITDDLLCLPKRARAADFF